MLSFSCAVKKEDYSSEKEEKTMNTFYLNNDGSKWIIANSTIRGFDRSPMDFILIREDGTQQKRRADYYESFGNFATVSFRINGLRYGGFFESFEKIDGLPVLRRYSRCYNKKDQTFIQSVESAIKEGKEVSDSTLASYYELMQDRIIDTTKE